MRRMTTIFLAAAFAIAALGTAACAEPKTNIVFAEVGWDSIRFHNAVAGVIAESVFGYSWEEISGSTPIAHEALLSGDIDVHMEVWTDNLANYGADLEAGKLVELGVNFDDNAQGLYVPRYVVEGDAARGIEAVAPDLRTVEDLKKYASVFPDPEDPGMGRIFGGIPGWAVTEILEKKVEAYGLTEMYNHVMPGSDAALSAAIVSAWDRGQPIVAYYWEPTWLMGMYDFVRLEDAPYDAATYRRLLWLRRSKRSLAKRWRPQSANSRSNHHRRCSGTRSVACQRAGSARASCSRQRSRKRSFATLAGISWARRRAG